MNRIYNENYYSLNLNAFMAEITVSVCVIAYKHARYISQCLESILMQKIDFAYEILLGEDDSDDGTRELCIEYAKKYPAKIRLFLNDRKNVIYINGKPTGRYNFIKLINNAKGKYIAICEGDDYWTDPYKLQKQVDFLENHRSFVCCFHAVEIISEIPEQGSRIATPHKKKSVYTLNDLLKGNFIHTCSVMFRSGLFGEFPEWFDKVAAADWSLHILNAQRGEIGYINEVLGAYRVHMGGIHSSKGEMDKVRGMIETYPYINRYLNYRYNFLIKSRMYFKLIEKKMGIALESLKLGRIVSIYRKLFYE